MGDSGIVFSNIEKSSEGQFLSDESASLIIPSNTFHSPSPNWQDTGRGESKQKKTVGVGEIVLTYIIILGKLYGKCENKYFNIETVSFVLLLNFKYLPQLNENSSFVFLLK